MHAFIIEDEYLIGQSLRDMLEQLGFTSFGFARSEDAAILGATAEKIDLITADVRLLPGDGVRAVEAICKQREIPVVFITGYLEELQDRAPTAVIVQKPVVQSELAAASTTYSGKSARHPDARPVMSALGRKRTVARKGDGALVLR